MDVICASSLIAKMIINSEKTMTTTENNQDVGQLSQVRKIDLYRITG